MKNLLLATVGLLAMGTSLASAADLPPRMPTKAPLAPILAAPSWTGFYIGVNGGGGWGRARQDFATVPGLTTGRYDVSGGLAGGTAGFNVQSNAIVFGIEGDLDWSGIKGTNSNRPTAPAVGGFACNGPAIAGGAGFTCSTENTWLATVRGRLGWAAPGNWMPYVTGGAAFGDVRTRVATDPGMGVLSGQSETRAGWTAGGGIEWQFAPSWSAKAEYLYVDLGKSNCAAGLCAPVAVGTTTRFQANTVKAGINYRFNWGGPVVAAY